MKSVKIIIIFFTILASCVQHGDYSKEYEKVLGGKHKLRKFNVKTENSTVTRGSYFLLMGSYSSRDVSETKVRFYFYNHRNEYQFMEFPLERVNIKLDSTIKEPYVKFHWRELGRTEKEWRTMYERDVTGIVIYCKEEDFQPEININDLK